MWQQNYTPIANSLLWSSIVAALPVAALLYAIGVARVAAWKSSLYGLGAALLVAIVGYRMPASLAINSALYGAAFGVFPIFWIIYWAIMLYRITVDTGRFEVLKQSIGQLTEDRYVQALLIAFAFGAFLEGAAGFGTPVAVAAAILAGLGFPKFQASAICLLANTAPVAFGSIGIPLITLAATTGLPIDQLSRHTGQLCTPVAAIIPAYLVLVMGGLKALRATAPAAILCGVTFGGIQLAVSTLIGPYLTDILSSLGTIAVLVIYLKIRKRKSVGGVGLSAGKILAAWLPYVVLVVCILVWSLGPVKAVMEQASLFIPWPGLHNQIALVQPVARATTPYAAVYRLRWLAESGTACAVAVLVTAVLVGVRPRQFLRLAGESAKQLKYSFLSIISVLALAFLMNYSGQTGTLGLAFASTASLFPFFSSLLGWLGVFLTGSDTSANALFGSLQVVTARRLGFDAALMASANSAGGVMGKMISLQSISVAATAAGLAADQEPALFRFTIRHSLTLACAVGVLTMIFAYAR